ncbi:MAG: tetratricopeptide repeat protein [Pseudomonadota bacterium]
MPTTCSNHPTRNALWKCNTCGGMLCRECASIRDKGGYLAGAKLYFCPKCNVQVEWLGIAGMIEPFWNRLPKIFLYPFSPHPLTLMIILAIGGLYFSSGGIFSWMMKGVIWLVVLKYSFEALKTTASGDLRPPALSARSVSNDYQQVIKQFAISLVIFLVFGMMAPYVGKTLAFLFLYLCLFLLPAMLILLVTTESLLQALNPFMFFRLAYRIGWGYVVMYLFLTLLGVAPAVAADLFLKQLPDGLHLFLFSFAKSYYTIISYHLMGYVVLQYHEQIGYKIDFEDFKDPSGEKKQEAPIDPEDTILKEINPIIQSGNIDGAISTIRQMAGNNGIHGLALADRYFALLQMKDNTDELIAHGKEYLKIIAEKGTKKRGLEVYDSCRKIDPAFLPAACVLLKMGLWFNENRKPKEAITAFQTLIEAYPEDEAVPKAYFRSAQVYHDGLMNPGMAKEMLYDLIDKYPYHELKPMAEKYLSSLGGA